MTPLIALPAAGAASRMRGRDKLLETIHGEPLLRRQARAALGTGCRVLVTLPPGGGARHKALEGLDVIIVEIPDSAEGMAASLRLVATHLADDQPLGLLLPDVPGIGTDEIATVLAEFRATDCATPTRGSDAEGRPGTPLFLPHRIARRLTGITGDEGGKAILKGEEIRLIPLHGDCATRDLDRPEDWATWRAETGILD